MSGDPTFEGTAPAPEQGVVRRLLRSRAVRSAAVEVAGFGGAQIIRLAANLVLTRLLFPAAFGVMAMLSVVYFGLQMLSDVGITQATIRSPHGDEPEFLDTAWTIHLIRGAILWLVACAAAWPTAVLFQEPLLVQVLPAGAAASLIYGFQSARVLTLRRAVRPLPIVSLELGSQVVSSVVMIGLAWAGAGVWALVAGNLVAAAINTGGSFLLPGIHRERFRIDPVARKEIAHFGQWIYFSSIVSFFAGRGDQLLLGRLLGAANLGLYNLGLALAEMPEALTNRVLGGVLYPTYARLQHEPPEKFREAYYRTRLAYDAVVHTTLGGLITLAPLVIDLLYDDRYFGATTMLQIVALRTSLGLLAAPCETALTSLGEPRYGFRRNLVVALASFALMPVGYALGGVRGVVWATTAARLPALAVLWPAARRRGFFRPWRELRAGLFLLIGMGLGLLAGTALAAVLRWLAPGLEPRTFF